MTKFSCGVHPPRHVRQTQIRRKPENVQKPGDPRRQLHQLVRIVDLQFPNPYRFSWQADRQSQYASALHFWYSVPHYPTKSGYDLL